MALNMKMTSFPSTCAYVFVNAYVLLICIYLYRISVRPVLVTVPPPTLSPFRSIHDILQADDLM